MSTTVAQSLNVTSTYHGQERHFGTTRSNWDENTCQTSTAPVARGRVSQKCFSRTWNWHSSDEGKWKNVTYFLASPSPPPLIPLIYLDSSSTDGPCATQLDTSNQLLLVKHYSSENSSKKPPAKGLHLNWVKSLKHFNSIASLPFVI